MICTLSKPLTTPNPSHRDSALINPLSSFHIPFYHLSTCTRSTTGEPAAEPAVDGAPPLVSSRSLSRTLSHLTHHITSHSLRLTRALSHSLTPSSSHHLTLSGACLAQATPLHHSQHTTALTTPPLNCNTPLATTPLLTATLHWRASHALLCARAHTYTCTHTRTTHPHSPSHPHHP